MNIVITIAILFTLLVCVCALLVVIFRKDTAKDKQQKTIVLGEKRSANTRKRGTWDFIVRSPENTEILVGTTTPTVSKSENGLSLIFPIEGIDYIPMEYLSITPPQEQVNREIARRLAVITQIKDYNLRKDELDKLLNEGKITREQHEKMLNPLMPEPNDNPAPAPQPPKKNNKNVPRPSAGKSAQIDVDDEGVQVD